MKNPSRRWVNPIEFERLSSGLPRKRLISLLRRCDRTIRDWQSGRRPIPAWTVDTLRLHEMERAIALREILVVSDSVEGLQRGGMPAGHELGTDDIA